MFVERSCPGAQQLLVSLQVCMQSDPSAKGRRSYGWLEKLALAALPPWGFLHA